MSLMDVTVVRSGWFRSDDAHQFSWTVFFFFFFSTDYLITSIFRDERIQFERCLSQPLPFITNGLPGSMWSSLLFRIKLRKDLDEDMKNFSSTKLKLMKKGDYEKEEIRSTTFFIMWNRVFQENLMKSGMRKLLKMILVPTRVRRGQNVDISSDDWWRK